METLKSIFKYKRNYIFIGNFAIFLWLFAGALLMYFSNEPRPQIDLYYIAGLFVCPILVLFFFTIILNNLDEWIKYNSKIKKISNRIEKQPHEARLYFIRGNLFFSGSNFDNAIDDYNTAIKLKPDFAEAFNNRGYAHSLSGYSMDFSNAIRDWEKAEKLGLKPKKNSIYKSIKSDEGFEDFAESLWTVKY